MKITTLKRFALAGLAAWAMVQFHNLSATQDVPLKTRTAGQYTARQFLMAPNFADYPLLGFPLNTKFVRISGSAVGNGTLIGKYTVEIVFDVEFAIVDGRLATLSDGTYTATAANGDQLFGTFRNRRFVGENTFTGETEMTGGTGRFEGATGHQTTVGIVFPDPSGLDSIYYELDGWASSVGSGMRD